MQEEYPDKPVLIYFKIRGNAQIIRSVLLEIGVAFDELYVTKDGYLDPQIIKKYGLQMDKLPYIVHQGHAISDVFPIIKYLCIFYNRGDLLGKTIEDSIRIAEILVKYSKQKNLIYSTLLQGLKEIEEKKLGEAALDKLAAVLTSILVRNKYCQATERMFLTTRQFLCGYLTILDFINYEKCFYFVNMLTVKCQPHGLIASEYVKFYEQTEFFVKNKEFLNKYKIFIEEMGSMNPLIYKMWIGDKNFLNDAIQ